jgi:hypothetical protein
MEAETKWRLQPRKAKWRRLAQVDFFSLSTTELRQWICPQ